MNPPRGDLGPLFADWPQAPPAPPVEQTVLPIGGTLEARYAAWRSSAEGCVVFGVIHDRALRAASQGAKRIGVKRLAEDVRGDLKRKVNNSLVAFIARELATDPALAGRIKMRVRKST